MRGRKTLWILWALLGLLLLPACEKGGDDSCTDCDGDGDGDVEDGDDDDDDSDGDADDDDDDDDDDSDGDADGDCSDVTCGFNAHCEEATGDCVCDDGYTGDPDVRCELPTITLPSSLNGRVFLLDGCYATEADETHTEEIPVTTTGLSEGDQLSASVDGGTAVTLTVNGSGQATWNPVIPYGEHVLRVESAANTEVNAIATVQLAGCSICPDPADGALLTGEDDLDDQTPNIQYNVSATFRHVTDATNATLRLNANDLGAQAVASGVATWPSVEFTHDNDDGHTLTFASQDATGNACEAQFTVRAIVDDCVVLVSTPIAIDPITGYWNLEDLTNGLDEDAGTEGVQVTFTAQVDASHHVVCQNAEMTFVLNHIDGETVTPEEVTVPISQDNTTFVHQFTIPEGLNTFRANIVDATDTNLQGSSGALAHNLDTQAPVPGSYEFSSGDQTCDAAIHMTLVEDLNHSLTDGIQFNLSGTVTGMEAGDQFCAQVRFAEPGLEDVNPDPVCGTYVDSDVWAFENLTLPRPAQPRDTGDDPYTLEVWFIDAGQNRADLNDTPCSLTADFRPVAESLKIVGIGKGGDPEVLHDPFTETQPICLLLADDADDVNNGLQVVVKVEAPQFPLGTNVAVQVDELSPVVGATGADRAVRITVTLAAGIHVVKAAATAFAVTLNSNTVNVNSALNPPSVSFVTPSEGAYLANQELAVTVASGASEGQTITVSHDGEDFTGILAGGRATVNVSLSDGDGPKLLTASVEDVCGNIGSADRTVNLDMSAPTPVFVTPLDDDSIGTSDPTTITVSYDGEAAGRTAYLRIYTSDPEAGSPSPLATMSDVLEDVGGTIQTQYVFSFADGEYWLKASYTDRSGNLGETVIHVTVSTGCYSNTLASPFNSATVLFGADDADGGNIANGVTRSLSVLGIGSNIATNRLVTVRINGSEAGSAMVDGNGEATIGGLRFPTEGTYSLVATFEHPSGIGTCTLLPGGMTVVVDFTPPAFSQIQPAATANPLTVPVKYNCASLNQGSSAAFRFGVSPTGQATLEEGQPVRLTVRNQAGTFTSTPYEAFVDGGEVLFEDVTIHGSLLPDLSTVTLTLEADDLAGNRGTYSFTVMADKQVPYFQNFNPSETTLTDDFNPATEEFDLALTINVMYGTPGAGAVRVQYRVGEDVYPLGNEYFNLVEVNATTSRANIIGVLPQGPVTLLLSHTDAFGNENCPCAGTSCVVGCCSGQSGPRERYYYIDSSAASMEFRDGESPFSLLEGRSTTWAASRDGSAATPGFQAKFLAVVGGMRNGVTVRVCSDKGDAQGGSVVSGRFCQGDAQGGAGYYIVAETVVNTDDIVKQVPFTNVPLLNERTHSMYIEAVDDLRYVRSEMGTLNVDSVRPAISSWSVTSNDPANDGTNLWLNASEGTVSGSNFQMDIGITSSSTDLATARVYRVVGDADSLVISKALSAGTTQATFTRTNADPVAVPMSPATHTLKVQLVDAVGNTSDITLPSAATTLRIDTIAPTVSIIESGNPLNLFSCDCNGDISGNCARNVSVSLGVQAGEPFPSRNVTVTLSNGVDAPLSLTVPANSGTIVFTDVPFPQGNASLTATARDEAHNDAVPDTNDYITDSLLPALSFTTPSGDTTFTDSSAGCSQAGQVLVCNGWQFSFGATNRAAQVELQKRPSGSGDDDWIPFHESSRWSFAASESPRVQDIGDVSLERGTIDVRLVAVETGTCNMATTAPLAITGDFTVTLIIGGYHADGQAVSGSRLHFLAAEKTGTGPNGEFLTSILVIGNDATNGLTPTLSVNGTVISNSQVMAFDAGHGDYRTLYTGVPLKEWDCAAANPQNAIRIDIGSGEDATFWTQTGIIADSALPSVSFSNPPTDKVQKWSRAVDRDGQINGKVLPLASPDMRIKISSTGLEAGQTATITAATDQGQAVALTNNTALIAVDEACDGTGSAVFENLAIPNANNNQYIQLAVSVKDRAGNSATFTGQPLQIRADDDPPAAEIGVCLGESTADTDPEAHQQEPAECASFCTEAGDCARRAGAVTIFFTAEGNGTTATNQDININAAVIGYMETTSPDDCSDFDWNTAATSDDLDWPIDWPIDGEGDGGMVQLIRGKDINVNVGKSYCFAVRVVDAAENVTESAPVAREIPLYVSPLGTNLSSSENLALGEAVAIGDFDCDGRPDVAVSDSYYDATERGRVFVWYGSDTPKDGPDLILAPPETLDGFSFGMRLATGNVGDNDTDTCDDLLVSSMLKPKDGVDWGGNYEGHVELFFGRPGGLQAVADYSFDGVNVDATYGFWNTIGSDIAIGNFDGDAFDDIVLGADNRQDGVIPGPVYLYRGRSHADWDTLDTNDDSILPVNFEASPYCNTCDLSIVTPVGSEGNIGYYSGFNHGFTVSTVDLNNDGRMDVIIDNKNSLIGGVTSDRIHVLLGDADFWSYTAPLQIGSGGDGVFITTEANVGVFDDAPPGWAGSVGGPSFNNDDYGDILFVGYSLKTRISLWYGNMSDGNTIITKGTYRFTSTATQALSFNSAGFLGDLNGDGRSEVFGTGYNKTAGAEISEFNIWFGRSDIFDPAAANPTPPTRTQKIRMGSFSTAGDAIVGFGLIDWNQDGYDDIGVVNADTNSVYILW